MSLLQHQDICFLFVEICEGFCSLNGGIETLHVVCDDGGPSPSWFCRVHLPSPRCGAVCVPLLGDVEISVVRLRGGSVHSPIGKEKKKKKIEKDY